jgi:hypothetical protein
MKHSKTREPNSIQKVILFCLFVVILIGISLGIRLFTLIKSSTFDGNHRYTLEIKKSDTEAKIISLDPTTKKMLIIFVRGKTNLPQLDIPLELPIDTVVTHDTSVDKSVITDISDLVMNLHVNAYDMLRIISAVKTIDQENIVRLTFDFPFSQDQYDMKIKDLMGDSGIVNDNKTISVINASNVSGIGSRFGQLIENAGGTVISVTSSSETSNRTKLIYYGNKSYTVRKLERLLHIIGEQKDGKGLSDVEITLGTNLEGGMK